MVSGISKEHDPMNKTSNIIFQKEGLHASKNGINTIFKVLNSKNHQTPVIPIQLEFSKISNHETISIFVNPWVKLTIFARTSTQIAWLEEGLPLPVSSGYFINGSGGIPRKNSIIWEAPIHLNSDIVSMMETIYNPQLGVILRVDWGATIMDLSQPQNSFARSWDCRLRITPNKWEDFSFLWK